MFYATGQTITSQQKTKPPLWNVLELGLDPPDLRIRIANRTENLYKNGLLEETEKLTHAFGADLPMLQTIGYGEALQVLESKLSEKEAIEITTRRTNQFAKRQRTWFRKQHKPQWLNNKEPLREALSLIKARLG